MRNVISLLGTVLEFVNMPAHLNSTKLVENRISSAKPWRQARAKVVCPRDFYSAGIPIPLRRKFFSAKREADESDSEWLLPKLVSRWYRSTYSPTTRSPVMRWRSFLMGAASRLTKCKRWRAKPISQRQLSFSRGTQLRKRSAEFACVFLPCRKSCLLQGIPHWAPPT